MIEVRCMAYLTRSKFCDLDILICFPLSTFLISNLSTIFEIAEWFLYIINLVKLSFLNWFKGLLVLLICSLQLIQLSFLLYQVL